MRRFLSPSRADEQVTLMPDIYVLPVGVLLVILFDLRPSAPYSS
jgi:hypothetical protein